MASAYLSDTFGTPTEGKKYTFSTWVKKSFTSDTDNFLLRGADGSSSSGINFSTSGDGGYGQIRVYEYSGSYVFRIGTNALLRDCNGWYHIVVAYDSTQATDSDRIKIYINGELQSIQTGNANHGYPSLNYQSEINNSGSSSIVGGTTSAGLDGVLAHTHFIDGTAYDADTFGETDSTTGIWKPKIAPSVTYGNNGFFFKYENSGAMGTDSSGNTNTYTVNGTITQTLDTPSNVFATLNALDATSQTLTNGNTSSFNIANRTSISTLGFSAGKYYWEVKNVTQNVYTMLVGITNETNVASGILSSNVGSNANGWSYFLQNNADNGKAFNNNTSSSVYQTVSQGDIVSIAVDADAGKIWWGVNGTWVNSGDPANGTNAVFTNVSTSETLFPAFTAYNGSGGNPLLSFNFGNGVFGTTAVSSAQNPDDGKGIFEYDVPAGYRALCTNSINAEEYS